MKGVEGLVKRGHRCVAASSVKDCTKLRFCFRFHKRSGVFSTFLSQFIEKTSFMQPDCKLSVYAMLYSYRGFVSVSTEMVGAFFFSFPPLSVGKIMSFPPNLARPRVRCFSIFAFTSSPLGYKSLSDSVISVKQKDDLPSPAKISRGGAQKVPIPSRKTPPLGEGFSCLGEGESSPLSSPQVFVYEWLIFRGEG